jgi:hypothetical protein
VSFVGDCSADPTYLVCTLQGECYQREGEDEKWSLVEVPTGTNGQMEPFKVSALHGRGEEDQVYFSPPGETQWFKTFDFAYSAQSAIVEPMYPAQEYIRTSNSLSEITDGYWTPRFRCDDVITPVTEVEWENGKTCETGKWLIAMDGDTVYWCGRREHECHVSRRDRRAIKNSIAIEIFDTGVLEFTDTSEFVFSDMFTDSSEPEYSHTTSDGFTFTVSNTGLTVTWDGTTSKHWFLPWCCDCQ